MSTIKTTTQQIEAVDEKILQYANRKKELLQKQKAAERKARTHRLCERGAILESFISDADKFTNDQIKAFLEKTVQSDYARKILNGFTEQEGTTAIGKSTSLAQGEG